MSERIGELDREEAPVRIDGAEGTDLLDEMGNRYIDGTSSGWRNVHGHRHPAVDSAVRDQLDRPGRSASRDLARDPSSGLTERLVAIAPPGLTRVLYSDSGSTAMEAALKAAFEHWRRRGGQHARRTSFIGLEDGFHGDTVGALSVSGIDRLRCAYEPLLFAGHSVPAGDADALARKLERYGEEIAAVIVEPLVQVAAGMRTQRPGYLRRVRKLCDLHGALLICDEAATGLGRTGTMFACEQEQVTPDILCLGGALSNGCLPLAATLTTEEIDASIPGPPEERVLIPQGAVGPNPLASAAAIATLDLFAAERTLLRLRPKIRLFGDLLDEVAAMGEVSEVRGHGFMAGIDLGPCDPKLRLARRVGTAARERGVIVEALGDTIALAPPPSISKADLVRLVAATADSVRVAAAAAFPEGRPASLEKRRLARAASTSSVAA